MEIDLDYHLTNLQNPNSEEIRSQSKRFIKSFIDLSLIKHQVML